MPSDTDILEVVLHGYYNTPDNRTINVFQYQVTSEVSWDMINYGQSFVDQWYATNLGVIQNFCSAIVAWDSVQLRNLSNELEVFEGAPETSLNGAVSGDCLPPYASWGFLYRRSTTITRNGYKRFAGVPESGQVNGIPTVPMALTLNETAAFLSAVQIMTLESASAGPDVVVQLAPWIVRKDTTGSMTLNQPVANVQFRRIGTQNTRKFGRGI